ncbi:uncharacterized protein LOC107036203 [Diachasma alloeum]|uniref:uncharacterized protein LOC107036203 n=1 Tax=Diachasma alloeum TaxID=454923 RepID=UPI000738456B|nr:uncharacterized protein LOC107036203 [Diachasma alloeum]
MESDVKYPIYKKGTVVYSADCNDFTCHICPGKQQDSFENHLKDENHVQRLVLYIQLFANVGPRVYCRLCPNPIKFSEIIEHAVGHQLMPWYVPDNCPEILFKNFISHRDHQYFCHLCNMKLPFWFLVGCHNEESHHQALKRDKIDESLLKDLSLSIAYYKLTTNNFIFMKASKTLACSLCACAVGASYEGIITHIEGKSHVKKEQEHIEALKSAEIYRLPPRFTEDPENPEDLSDEGEGEASDPSKDEDTQLIVSIRTVCNSLIDSKDIESHLLIHKSEKETRKRKRKRNRKKSKDVNTPDILQSIKRAKNFGTDDVSANDNESDLMDVAEEVEEMLECSLTKEDIKFPVSTTPVPEPERENEKSEESLFIKEELLEAADGLMNGPPTLHSDIDNHQDFPEEISYIREKECFWCKVCKSGIHNYKDVWSHLGGKRHKKNQQGKGHALRKGIIHLEDDEYECFLCERKITGLIAVEQHVNESLHQDTIKLLLVSSESSALPDETINSREIGNGQNQRRVLPVGVTHHSGKQYYCCICQVKLTGSVQTIQHHMRGFRHMKIVEEICQENTDVMSSKGTNSELSFPSSALSPSISAEELPGEVRREDTPEETTIRSLPKGIIHIYGNSYTCILCCCNISGLDLVEDHVENIRHQDNIQQLHEKKLASEGSSGSSSTLPASSGVAGQSENIPNTNEKRLEGQLNLPDYVFQSNNNGYGCSLCECSMPCWRSVEQHVVGLRHQTTVQFSQDGLRTEALPEGIHHIKGSLYMCSLCECRFSHARGIGEHMASQRHRQAHFQLKNRSPSRTPSPTFDEPEVPNGRQNLPDGIIHVYDNLYVCSVCKLHHVPGWNFVNKHVQDPQHEANLLQFPERISNRETRAFPNGIIHLYEYLSACLLCKCEISGDPAITQHIKGSRHQKTIESINLGKNEKKLSQRRVEMIEGITKVPGTDYIKCEICNNQKLPSLNGAIGHFYGKNHQMNLEKKFANLPNGIVSTEIDNLFWCRTCDTALKGLMSVSSHSKSEEHGLKHANSFMEVRNAESDSQQSDSSNYTLRSGDKVNIDETSGTNEASALPVGIIYVHGQMYECSVCNCRISGVKVIRDHINGSHHQNQVLYGHPGETSTRVTSNGGNPEKSTSLTSPPSSEKRCWKNVAGFSNEEFNSGNVRSSRSGETVPSLSSKSQMLESINHLPRGILHILEETYKCSLCKHQLVGLKSVEKHIKTLYHQRKVLPLLAEQSNSPSFNVMHTEQIVFSSSTSSTPPRASRSQEAMSEELPQQPAGEFLPPGKEVFFTECEICYQQIFGGLEAITEHTNSQRHRESRDALVRSPQIDNLQAESTEPELNTTNDTKYFIIESQKNPDESIFSILEIPKATPKSEGKVFYWCNICEIKIPNTYTPDKHLKCVLHAENLREKSEGSGKAFSKPEESDETETSFAGIFRTINWIICVICDNRKFSNNNEMLDHVRGWTHRYQLWNLSGDQLNALSLDESLPEGIEAIPGVKFLLCTICNSRVRPNYVDAHVTGNIHLGNGEKVISRISTLEFRCDVCSCILKGHKDVMKHLKDEDHLKNMTLEVLNSPVGLKDHELPEGIIRLEGENTFWCMICSKRIKRHWATVMHHATKEGHKDKLKQLEERMGVKGPEKPLESLSSGVTVTNTAEEENLAQLESEEYESVDDDTALGMLEPLEEKWNTHPMDLLIPLHMDDNEFSEGQVNSVTLNIMSLETSISPPSTPSASLGETYEGIEEGPYGIICTICNNKKIRHRTGVPGHVQDQTHIFNSSKVKAHLPEGIEALPHKAFLLCTICNCEIQPEEVQEHVLSADHLEKGPRIISRLEEHKFKCEICNCLLHGYERTVKHLSNEHHLNNNASEGVNNSVGELPPVHGLLEGIGKGENFEELCSSPPSTPSASLGETYEGIEEGPYGIICTICNNKKIRHRTGVPGHVQGQTHIFNSSKLKAHLPEGIEALPHKAFLFCTICNCKVQLQEVQEHGLSADHMEKGPRVISRIEEHKFKCESCNCLLHGYKNTVKHLTNEHHLNNNTSERANNLLEDILPQLLELLKGIVRTENLEEFWCTVCSVNVVGNLIHATVHAGSEEHQQRIKELREEKVNDEHMSPESPINDVQSKTEECYDSEEESASTSIFEASESFDKVHLKMECDWATQVMSEESKDEDSKIISSELVPEGSDDDSERTDEQSLPIDENIGLKSNSHESPATSENLPDGIERCYTKKRTQSFLICTICICRLSKNIRVEQHVASVDHRANGEKVIVRIDIDRFNCEICNCTLLRPTKLFQHLRGAEHRENKALKQPSTSAEAEKLYPLPEGIVRLENDDRFWCQLCSTTVPGTLLHVNLHISKKSHQKKVEKTVKKELNKEPLTKKPKEVSESAAAQVSERSTTAHRLISTFQLDNQEDPVSPRSSVESEDNRKILPQSVRNVPCEICNCMIPGGNWNVNAHRNSKEHLENEAKVNAAEESPDNTDDEEIFSPPTPQEFSLSDIPPDMMLEYHYVGDIIDCIECKVCEMKIRATRHTPATLEYLQHSMSQEHKDNEIVFIDSWKLSRTSYAAKAAAPQSKTQKDIQFMQRPKKKIPCRMCGENFEEQKKLHSHMTTHFWKRFLKASPMSSGKSTEELSKQNEDELKPTELQEEEEDLEFGVEQLPDSPKDDENLEFDVRNLGDSPEETQKSPPRFRQKPLDIELDKELNIYEIDQQRIEDMKLGVLLSFAIDKDNIYCLVCRKSVKNSLQNFYEHLSSVDHLDYLQEMIEDHKKFRDYPDQFSDLALAHEYMQEVSEENVQCHACGVSVPNDALKLSNHIQNSSHAERWSSLGSKAAEIFKALHSRMESNFYNARKYWCAICPESSIVEIEFREHLKKKKHVKKAKLFENETLIFDYCAVCATLWYGFLKTFAYHSTCKMHRDLASSHYYLLNKLPQFAEKLLYAAEDKIQEILARVDSRRIDEKKKEDQVVRNLEKIAKQKYPSAKAYPFGSRISGLGGRNSDLDIFLDCSTKKCQVYAGENSSYRQILVRLKNIKSCLEEDLQNWYISGDIQDCRIPIIKVTHRSTEIECDISFTNGLTVENTKIISAYCENCLDCRKLIIFVKNWMGHCDLTGLNGVNSYGIAWLVIYFLQVTSILPTIAELIDRSQDSRIIAGWETGVSTDFQPRTTDNTFRELLKQFFTFYADFDYRNYVICPLLGKPVEKKLFLKPNELPSDMKLYLDYLNEVDEPEPFRVDSIMCLQDPFDLSHNISKAVKKFTVGKLKTFCSLSAQILDNNS